MYPGPRQDILLLGFDDVEAEVHAHGERGEVSSSAYEYRKHKGSRVGALDRGRLPEELVQLMRRRIDPMANVLHFDEEVNRNAGNTLLDCYQHGGVVHRPTRYLGAKQVRDFASGRPDEAVPTLKGSSPQ